MGSIFYDMYYGDLITMLLLVIGIVVVLYAQFKINAAYNKYKKVRCSREINGAEAARLILKDNGLDLYVLQTPGNLTDHYDPSRKVVKLSTSIFNDNTIASIAVAAHECGHAIQDKEGYVYMRIRSALVPVVNLVNYMGYIGMFVSIFAGITQYFLVAMMVVFATLVFQLVTLPVEFDASRRGLAEIQKLNLCTSDELRGVKAVLDAAAFTYVAGTLSSLLQLLRIIIMFRNNKR